MSKEQTVTLTKNTLCILIRPYKTIETIDQPYFPAGIKTPIEIADWLQRSTRASSINTGLSRFIGLPVEGCLVVKNHRVVSEYVDLSGTCRRIEYTVELIDPDATLVCYTQIPHYSGYFDRYRNWDALYQALDLESRGITNDQLESFVSRHSLYDLMELQNRTYGEPVLETEVNIDDPR